ncbi:unnamed protein product [Orchesella dallaii]|uniref:F-box domain-containing protein n=1 Tax=Orchesella dallaii TaxID=48710 RepID=A0ABP1RIW4_9HEXA
MASKSSQNGNLRRSARIAGAQQASREIEIPELPIEMIAHIVQFLDKNWKSLLNCRLVNKSWRGGTDVFLKRRSHQNWTTWSPTFPLFPKWNLVPNPNPRSGCLPYVQVPLGLSEHEGNPFPSQCLMLIDEDRVKSTAKYESVAFNKLLQNIGCHLTTFILSDVTITQDQLDGMLTQLVHLKAITFSNITLKKVSKKNLSTKKSAAKPIHSLLPLESLRAVYNCDARIIKYMVDQFGHQLVNLEVDASKLKPFVGQKSGLGKAGEKESVPAPPALFKNLTRLELYSPSSYFLKLSKGFALKNLCVMGIHKEHKITPEILFKFIDQFSETLVYLRLDIDFQELKLVPRDMATMLNKGSSLAPIGAKFSKLIRLDVRIPSPRTMQDGWLFIKRHLLPKFPELKYLHIVPIFKKVFKIGGSPKEELEVELAELNAKLQFNLVCPKLKRLTREGVSVYM